MRATKVVVRDPAGGKPRIADQLRNTADDVRRIGDGFRNNPESIAIAKDDVAQRLVVLACELEREQ